MNKVLNVPLNVMVMSGTVVETREGFENRDVMVPCVIERFEFWVPKEWLVNPIKPRRARLPARLLELKHEPKKGVLVKT